MSKIKLIYDIRLSFVYPPIPERHSDWAATREGYEPGSLIGWGRTPIAALADLLDQEFDKEEV